MMIRWTVFYLLLSFSFLCCRLSAAPFTPFALNVLASDGEFRAKECSPVGLWLALSVLAQASQGQTKSELLQLIEEKGEGRSLERTLISLSQLKAMKLSLGLFAQEGVVWKSAFLRSLKGLYSKISVENCPFQKDPSTALQQINQWAKEATEGEIVNFLHKDDIDPETVAYLLSVLYFSQSWQEPFYEQATNFESFSIDGREKKVRMMHSSETVAYASCPFGDYIEKPLRMDNDEGEYVVEFLLPHKKVTKEEVQKALSFCREVARPRWIALSLPKSKGHSVYTWNEWLQKQGVRTLFTNEADFSPLSPTRLAVQKIKEATTVSLTEAGVVVADIVAVSFRCTASRHTEPIVEVRFNKPFFFFVREKKSDTIVSCSYIGSFEQLLQK